MRAPLSSQSNVIHLLTPLPLQEIIFLLRRAGHESKTTRDRDIIEQANSPRKFGGSEWRRLDDDAEARRGEARRYVDTNSKKEMMESKRQRGGRLYYVRADHRSEDPDRVGVQAGASPPWRSLSYVSHFDVLRQHVTRVFTNGGQRRAEACEERKPRTRTCTHIGRETARMRRWPVRATHTRRQ